MEDIFIGNLYTIIFLGGIYLIYKFYTAYLDYIKLCRIRNYITMIHNVLFAILVPSGDNHRYDNIITIITIMKSLIDNYQRSSVIDVNEPQNIFRNENPINMAPMNLNAHNIPPNA